MNEIESQNLTQFQEVKPRKKRRERNQKIYKCAAFVIMVILLGTMFAYIVGMTIGNPIAQEDPSENELSNYDFMFVNRAEWHARRPKQTEKLNTPVPFVVIHHSFSPPACYNNEQCIGAMHVMQTMHMDMRGWWDIGYNFAVGSNGVAYEGRGWKTLGAHAKSFNTVSIGICLIGDWTSVLPSFEQLKTAKKLIEAGVALGYISPDYKLIGHRQVRETDCPGDALFKEIKTWEHYSSFPNSVKDLINVKELPAGFRERLRNMTAIAENEKVTIL